MSLNDLKRVDGTVNNIHSHLKFGGIKLSVSESYRLAIDDPCLESREACDPDPLFFLGMLSTGIFGFQNHNSVSTKKQNYIIFNLKKINMKN